MKKLTAILLVSAFAATPAFAQAGFTGTWKADSGRRRCRRNPTSS